MAKAPKKIKFRRNGDDWKQVARDAFLEGRDDDAIKIIQRETETATIFWNEEFFGQAYETSLPMGIRADIPGRDARKLGVAGKRVWYAAYGIYDANDGFLGPEEAFAAVGVALQFHDTDGIGYVKVAVRQPDSGAGADSDHPWDDRLIFAAYSRAQRFGDDNENFLNSLELIKREIAEEKARW